LSCTNRIAHRLRRWEFYPDLPSSVSLRSQRKGNRAFLQCRLLSCRRLPGLVAFSDGKRWGYRGAGERLRIPALRKVRDKVLPAFIYRTDEL